MTRRLLAGYLALAVLVLVALEIPLGISYSRSERRDLERRVEHDAATLATFFEDLLTSERDASPPARLQEIADAYQRQTGGRVVAVGTDGVSRIDSAGSPGRSFASRPEIRTALRTGDVATGVRHSDQLGTDLLYVAVAVASGGRIHGAVRITLPTSALDARIHRYWLTLAGIAGVVLVGAGLLGLALTRSIARPLDRVRLAALAAAEDRSARAPTDDGPPEVRQLAASINRTVAALDELVRSREAFVADASHQLRTPLTALRLRLENLERDVAPAGRADLDGALAEVQRLAGLVDALLALARADAAEARPEPVDLAVAGRGRVAAWSALAEESGVRLVAGGDDAVWALATPGHVEQMLDNLLANALEVSPAGGELRVEAGVAGGWAELHVVDQGPGLPAEDRRQALERFARPQARGGGSGLGLAIVAQLASRDGGAVELREAPGGGVDATVRLPRAAP